MAVAGRKRSNIVDELHRYSNSYTFMLVKWIPLESGWLKGNTDGASEGNPGPSSIAF